MTAFNTVFLALSLLSAHWIQETRAVRTYVTDHVSATNKQQLITVNLFMESN